MSLFSPDPSPRPKNDATLGGDRLARIDFQGVFLPPYAIVIDLATNARLVGLVDEEMAIWFWRFTICVGAYRHEQSSIVQKHVRGLMSILSERSTLLLPNLARQFPDADPNVILHDWIECLQVMERESLKTHECEWSAD